MLVSELLSIKGKVLYTVAPERGLAGAVAVMAEQDVGSLVVFSHGRMVGLLTFREVLQALNATGADWAARTVADVMLTTPFTASPMMEMDELRRMMVEHHQRYVPVMEDTTLLGVISFHDVARGVLEAQSFENRLLKNYIMNWPDEAGQDAA